MRKILSILMILPLGLAACGDDNPTDASGVSGGSSCDGITLKDGTFNATGSIYGAGGNEDYDLKLVTADNKVKELTIKRTDGKPFDSGRKVITYHNEIISRINDGKCNFEKVSGATLTSNDATSIYGALFDQAKA